MRNAQMCVHVYIFCGSLYTLMCTYIARNVCMHTLYLKITRLCEYNYNQYYTHHCMPVCVCVCVRVLVCAPVLVVAYYLYHLDTFWEVDSAVYLPRLNDTLEKYKYTQHISFFCYAYIFTWSSFCAYKGVNQALLVSADKIVWLDQFYIFHDPIMDNIQIYICQYIFTKYVYGVAF